MAAARSYTRIFCILSVACWFALPIPASAENENCKGIRDRILSNRGSAAPYSSNVIKSYCDSLKEMRCKDLPSECGSRAADFTGTYSGSWEYTEGPKKGKGKKCDDFIVGIDKEKSKYYTKGSTTGAKYEEKYFDGSELRCYKSTNKITVTMTIEGDQITTREWSGGGEAGKWDDVRKMTCKEREEQ